VRVVVTGAGGFIGSHLCETLAAGGHDVLGVDCLLDSDSPSVKRRKLAAARAVAPFKIP